MEKSAHPLSSLRGNISCVHLATYLSRLGLEPPLPPTIDTLRKIHAAHLGAFPFHNLEIQKRGVVRVDIESIEKKFFGEWSGGYCFEQNTLLASALRELGFTLTVLLARVGPPEKRYLNHMLLRVDIDGEPWIADVGFGAEGPIEPLPLRHDARVMEEGIEYEVARRENHWTLTMHCSGKSEEMYEFADVPHTTIDVEMANYFTSTHPSSVFRRTLTIQRATREERLILRPTVVTRYRGGTREDTPITPAEVRSYALQLFGVDLGEAPLLYEDPD